MENKNIILEMFKLQHKFNDNTNGEVWLQGITKENKKINWKLCYIMEMMEAMDSLSWKHWKGINEKADIDNYKIEIVDAWHFLMSELIIMGYRYFNTKDNVLKYISEHIEKYHEYEVPFKQELTKINYNKNKDNGVEDLYLITNNLISSELTIKNMVIFFKAIMVILEDKFNFDWNMLYKYYIGKNALNAVRQNNGYKDGKYNKIWNNKEDNQVMLEIINNLDIEHVTFDNIKKILTEIYNKI